MRGFNWTKLPYARIKSTIWESLDDNSVQFDSQLLEYLFSSSSSSASISSSSPSEKVKDISLLDNKRSQNISIMLTRFKGKDLNELKEAILSVNLNILSYENSHSLYSFAPDKEETDLINEYTGDHSLLAKAEQFVLMTIGVPRFKERLYAISVIQSFDSKLSSCHQSIKEMHAPVTQVKSSQKIKEFLEIVLAIGNYMNGSTMRGGAFGYKLDSLTKLFDVRSTSENGQTLLHFIIRTIQTDRYNHLLTLPQEIPSLDFATRYDFKQTISDLNDLKPALEKLNVEISACNEDDPLFTFHSFWETSTEKLTEVRNDLALLQKDYKEILMFYGEDEKTDYTDFFSIFISFFSKFTETIEDLKRKEMEEKRAKQKQQNSPNNQQPSQNNNKQFNPFAGAEGRGLLDNLLVSMKKGCFETFV